MSRVAKCDEFLCYLQINMKYPYNIATISLVILSLLICLTSCSREQESYFSETAKVALRDVGHQLLLKNQDSTSLVKPVIQIDDSKFQLEFESDLAIHPDSLVNTIKMSFNRAELPEFYFVEVRQCEDEEVAYSYEMKQNIEKGIIPCNGRQLHKKCYTITVIFTNVTQGSQSANKPLLAIGFLIVLLLAFLYYNRKSKVISRQKDPNYTTLGRFKFYPEQNKLIKEAIEISLSKKECEILAILVSQPNQIVKREELTKRVWEDNGVVVGRSLDTYISKLRKKLKEDSSIKLINVHGVGYKLEIA